jgi:hypothetical protein
MLEYITYKFYEESPSVGISEQGVGVLHRTIHDRKSAVKKIQEVSLCRASMKCAALHSIVG